MITIFSYPSVLQILFVALGDTPSFTSRMQLVYNGKYYYNNFEVAHVPSFRHSTLHWAFFLECDRRYAFFIGPTKKNGAGDADFRSLAVPYLLKSQPQSQLHDFQEVGYMHPVSWDTGYWTP